MTKHVVSYLDLLQRSGDKTHRSDIYHLDDKNEFRKIAWDDYVHCIHETASSIRRLVGNKRIV